MRLGRQPLSHGANACTTDVLDPRAGAPARLLELARAGASGELRAGVTPSEVSARGRLNRLVSEAALLLSGFGGGGKRPLRAPQRDGVAAAASEVAGASELAAATMLPLPPRGGFCASAPPTVPS